MGGPGSTAGTVVDLAIDGVGWPCWPVLSFSGQGSLLLTTPLTTPGALLQDYFNDLCLYLRRTDVIDLKNCEQMVPLYTRGGWGLSYLTFAGAFWWGDASPGWGAHFPLHTVLSLGRQALWQAHGGTMWSLLQLWRPSAMTRTPGPGGST